MIAGVFHPSFGYQHVPKSMVADILAKALSVPELKVTHIMGDEIICEGTQEAFDVFKQLCEIRP